VILLDLTPTLPDEKIGMDFQGEGDFYNIHFHLPKLSRMFVGLAPALSIGAGDIGNVFKYCLNHGFKGFHRFHRIYCQISSFHFQ